jgi:hypothetical protein
MALLEKIDSNITGLRYAEEASLGLLPDPESDSVWKPLEPNSYSDFGGEITTIARNPINPSRQRKKGVTTDLKAAGGFNTDLTQENLQDILQGFFFADLRRKDEHDVATVGIHYEALSAVVVAGGTSGYVVGDLLTLVGGTFGTVAKAYVATVSGGGVVLTVNFTGTGAVKGDYTVVPANPVSTTTSGAGVGTVTLTVTWETLEGDYVVTADGDNYVAGDLVFAKNFDDAINNGLKHAVAGSTTTSVKVSETLVDAATQTGTISRVGYKFGSGELSIDVSGDLPKLVSTGRDLTEFGLIPGEWIFIGGDGTNEKFVAGTGEGNGFARVRSVSVTEMELDKTANEMVTDTGAGKVITLFFGRILKNELGSLIKRRTYHVERTLGAPDTSLPNDLQAEYLVGAVPNEFAMNVKTADKITCDLTFVAIDNEQVDAGNLKDGTRPPIREAAAFNTSSDIPRIKLSKVDPSSGDVTPLFAFAEDLKLTIKNNATPNKAIGKLGAFEVTVGTFAVGGDLTVYFADVAATRAVRENADVTIDFHTVKQNGGITFDIPLLSLGDARVKVEQDKAITLPLSVEAATGAKIHTDLDYTLLMEFWDYLPDLANTNS